MKTINLERYYTSIINIKKMLKEGIINKTDYDKAETFFANKYCINLSDLYRVNDLIKSDFRGIYMMPKEEEENEQNNSNENRRITEIRKEN